MRTALIPLRRNLREGLRRQKETIGYNLAALRFIQRQNDARRTAEFFEQDEELTEEQVREKIAEGGKKRKSRGEDAEGKRRAKKPKDPNAPKRPASSYLLFQNDVRNELKAKNPGMRNNELLSAIAKLWAEMPQEQKDVSTLARPHGSPLNCL